MTFGDTGSFWEYLIIANLLLTVIGLKLTGVINWSWWWVLSPALLSTAIVIITLIAAVVVASKR